MAKRRRGVAVLAVAAVAGAGVAAGVFLTRGMPGDAARVVHRGADVERRSAR